MAWGFQSINNGGAIQIDADFSNMAMFMQGELDLTDRWEDWYEFDIDFPARPNPPLVAVQTSPPGESFYGACTLMGMQGPRVYGSGAKSIDSVRLQMHTMDAIPTYVSTWNPPNYYRPTTVKWGLFDTVGDVIDNTDWGMQVFDEDEKVTFDSRRSYLSIVDIVDIPDTSYPGLRKRIPGDGDQGDWGPDGGPFYYSHAYVPNAWYIINSISGQIHVPSGTGFFGATVWAMRLRQHSNTQVELWWHKVTASTSSKVKSDTRQAGKLLICKEVFI